MADYKIANIKWLRDQGWNISLSYASDLCPTYNEIVNEIPKDSITVDVNETCIATSKAYTNNQLVCEGDITIVPSVDCSEYEFNNLKPQTDQGAHVSVMLATSNYDKEQLSWTINDNWITSVTAGSYTPTPGVTFWAYGCNVEANPTASARTGSVTFTSTDGCSFLATCTQEGEPTIIATLTLNNGSTVDIEGSGELTSSMIESYKTTVTKAEIKDTCTSIGTAAFQSCSSLTSVTIPNSVTSIGSTAFASCSSLTSIDIPNSVTNIAAAAFQSCTSLTSVTIPNSVTSISNSVFASCSSLTSVTIPNSVTSIGSTVFASCRNLASVTIGNSVTSIGNGAFSSCISLTNVTLPNSVTTIGNGAFSGCNSLTSITFPSSVINIGGGVLTACTSLERITVERVEPPTITDYTFDSTNECPIYVPCESVNTYKTSWSRYADRITCDSVDCDAYEFNIDVDYFNYDETEGDIATTTSSMPQLTATVKSGFITNPITVRKDGDYYYYSATFSENTGSPFSRSAVIEFTDGKGCVFSEDVGQGGVGCEGYYGLKRETSEVSSDSGRYLIATSNASMAALTPTITEGSSFLTEVEVFQNLTKYEYYGHFNPNTSTSSRTAEIIYRSYQVDGCVFRQTVKQKGKEGGDETYTVYVTSEPDESSCARVLIADGGSIEFTLSIGVGGTTHTLKYLVNNRQEFGGNLERFGTINVPIGQISSFDFNYLSTDTGNILKANSSSNGNKLPELTTQWSTLGSNTELWEGGAIPNLCTGDENGNRFVVSWDINTTTKTIVIYYMYQDIN